MTERQIKKRRHKRIAHWDDERRMGNSLIVTLVPGWKFPYDVHVAEHVRGYDRVKDAMSEVRETVPCDCADCKKILAIKVDAKPVLQLERV